MIINSGSYLQSFALIGLQPARLRTVRIYHIVPLNSS